ncbi:hypothetical protein DFH08DRAFT_916490 [Mycena albidolilacea]|uniref:NAD(P)-binding protein n=1 Tax=Mycena albidolilacea TaxID=1033008 RepID=A0AAD7EKS6_9AGAR|nr:hypothetical protein DFH08DRAFT_916490 [Mycena albidolilacea]
MYHSTLHFDPPSLTYNLPGLDKHMAIPAEHSKPYLKEYAIITGGDSGIGQTATIFFAREGADIRELEPNAKSLKSEITKNSSTKIRLLPIDLTTQGAAQKILSAHLDKFGALDILVNTSKQIMSFGIEELKDENILSTFQTNIIQMMQLTREPVPRMKCGAAIINTLSVVAYKKHCVQTLPAQRLGAITMFMRSLATQLASKGIHVNAGWGVGQPAEIREAYVVLTGPGGDYITGTVIHVNGGVHIGGA